MSFFVLFFRSKNNFSKNNFFEFETKRRCGGLCNYFSDHTVRTITVQATEREDKNKITTREIDMGFVDSSRPRDLLIFQVIQFFSRTFSKSWNTNFNRSHKYAANTK